MENKLLYVIIILFMLLGSGCSTKVEWYESGQVKSYRKGFIEWSDGGDKNLPLSHLSVMGK